MLKKAIKNKNTNKIFYQLYTNNANPPLEDVYKRTEKLEEATNNILINLNNQNKEIEKISDAIEKNKNSLNEISKDIKFIEKDLNELESTKIPQQNEAMRKENSDNIQSSYKQIASQFSKLSESFQALQPEKTKAPIINTGWLCMKIQKIKQTNQQDQGEWVTGYKFIKLLAFGVVGILADWAIKRRSENLNRIQEIKVIVGEENKKIYTKEFYYNNLVFDTVINGQLYLNVENSLNTRIALEDSIQQRLTVNQQIRDELNLIAKNSNLGTFWKWETKNQADKLLEILNVHHSHLRILKFINNSVISLQLRQFDQARSKIDLGIHYVHKLSQAVEKHKEYFGDLQERTERTYGIRHLAANLYNLRGIINRRVDKFDLSLEDFTIAVTLDPMNGIAHSNRGFLLTQEIRTPKALEHAKIDHELANQLNPNNSFIINGLGDHYYRMAAINDSPEEKNKYIQKAKINFEKASNLDKQNLIVIQNLGLALASINIDEGLQKLTEAERSKPYTGEIGYYIGYLLAVKGKFPEAKDAFIRAKRNLLDFPTAVELIDKVIILCDKKDKSYFKFEKEEPCLVSSSEALKIIEKEKRIPFYSIYLTLDNTKVKLEDSHLNVLGYKTLEDIEKHSTNLSNDDLALMRFFISADKQTEPVENVRNSK